MAAGKRDGMLLVPVVLFLFCCTCQFVSVTSQLRDKSKVNQRSISGSASSCIPVFEVKYPRTHSQHAMPQLKTQNEESCKNACVADERCVSYQIDTNPEHDLCWLQLNKENLVLDRMLELGPVTEYILVSRCRDPEAEKLTIKHNLCFPVFENKNPGWVSRQALFAPEEKTEDECKAACVTIPACVSYQTERRVVGTFCWLQYSEQRLIKDQMYQTDTVKEYVLVDRCPKFPATSPSCIPVFDEKYPRIHSQHALPQLKTQNEEACRNACVADERCVSYQIDTNPEHDLCWLQLNKENLVLDRMLELWSVTEYILVSRCRDPEKDKLTIEHNLCFPVFENKNPGWVSHMAANIPDAKTEDECKAACVTVPVCVSYQTERRVVGTFCFLQYNKEKLIKDQLYQSNTTKEYVVVDRCPKFPGLVTTTKSPDICLPVFENKNPGWVSRQVVSAPYAKNEDECKDDCVKIPACVSYQIERKVVGINCLLQYNEQNLVKGQMYQSDTIKEYVLVKRCQTPTKSTERGLVTTTKSPDICLPIFENKNPGWVSRQVANVPDVKTEDECKDACVKIPACVSYQIERKVVGINCLLQYNEQNLVKGQMYQSDTIKEYVLVKRCQTPSENAEKGLVTTTKSPDICLPIFESKNPGWVSRQVANVPDVKTEDECKDACVKIPACVSYQIERKVVGINCLLQYNEQNLVKGQMYQSDTTKEYVLVKRCQTPTENAEKECYVTMKPSLYGQLSANATLLESAKDERTCVAACIAKSDCISVQFKFSDKNWLCFLQHNFQAFKPENLMYHPNVTEYVITKRCHENNACSRGFPLKRWGASIYFRMRRNSDDNSEANIEVEGSYEPAEKTEDAEGPKCEVLIQLVNYGLSTPNAVPLKSVVTDRDCVAACVADKGCISTQHYRNSTEGFIACSLQYDIKAFEPKTLLYRPNVTEYTISKRCSEDNPCSIGHQSHTRGQ